MADAINSHRTIPAQLQFDIHYVRGVNRQVRSRSSIKKRFSLLTTLLALTSLAAASVISRQDPGNTTSTESLTDPIGEINPFSIIPIPLSLARSIIPAKYKILTSGIKALAPWLSDGAYPVVLRTTVDHDIRLAAFKDAHFRNIFGIAVDVAFLENRDLPCETLKRYQFNDGDDADRLRFCEMGDGRVGRDGYR
ncbi:hypothetical protein BJ878DRAFT_577337 [Calycina marina]|uniref:Uncharacterized protein n=1 Tax=Calycina marina TaxID=1763456 RepID=A0A9P7Z0C6_9HELO|nr:hypothetical protein BJ878DRAFT_577337 [Calycina marina]